ncbi:MAG: hypothetical protein ACTSRS_21045 [Candidatus Helarchaeota archaeon]
MRLKMAIIGIIFCWLFIFYSGIFSFNIHDTKPIFDNTNPSLSTSSILLNQVPSHPNLTYSLHPIYNDRYFGQNIFNLTITKIQGPALDIIIPLGQFLNTTATDFQNVTIARPLILNLTAGSVSNSTLLSVFCINLHGEVPSSIIPYIIDSTIATGDLALVLNYIHNHSLFNLHYAQLAVWAISEGPTQIPSGYIYNNTEVQWANQLLADAGVATRIPEIPIIPGFEGLYLLITIFTISFFIYQFKIKSKWRWLNDK